jgi:NADPH:quinone reductase
MRAVTAVEGSIEIREFPDPVPGTGQILVRVRAAGINGADLMQKAGRYPAPPGAPADILGLELAGEVAAIGPGATRFGVGDRVMSVVGGGAQSAFALLHEREAMAIPEGLPWSAAGGLPEAFMTAHDALFTQCGLAMGERVCVHGAAGGVGSAAVQLAACAGASVVATVRNPDLRDAVAALGATAIKPEETSAHGPYNVIVELIGGPNVAGDIEALATGGRISIIGVSGGSTAEVNLLALMARRGRIHGSTLRARPLEEKSAAARALEAQVLPLFAAGRIRVPVAATYPLEDAAAAYERFSAGGKFGKIVITM